MMPPSLTRATLLLAVAAVVGGCDLLQQALPQAEYTPLPIPVGPGSPTSAPDVALYDAWERRNLLEAYQQVGHRDPLWDEAVLEFIPRHSLVTLHPDELEPEARRILALGCDDPLVLYLAALDIWYTDHESGEATRLFERAFLGMKEVPYPRGVARFVVSGLHRDYGRRRDGRAQMNLEPLELAWFQEAMTDGSYTSGDEVVLAQHLRWGSGSLLQDRKPAEVAAAVAGNQALDEWVRLLISGRGHTQQAYDARGYGYADTVTAEGWRGFRRELGLARDDLERAWELRPDRPEIAVAIMELVKSGNVARGECIRIWFDRAVALQIDYWAAYTTMLDDLQPQWHGSAEEMLEFARECADTERYDTDIPRAVYQALDFLEGRDLDPLVIYREPQVYPLVSRVAEGYLATPLPVGRRRENLTHLVLAAHAVGRNAEACARAVAVDGDLDREVLADVGERARPFAGRICALATAGERLSAADELYEAGEWKAPLQAFEETLRAESEPLARAYLRHRIAALRLEGKLEGGEWVPFLPTEEDLAGWDVQLGRWELDSTGALRGTSISRGMIIRSKARVGPRFEIRGEYELVETSNEAFQAGVVFGYPHAVYDWWLSFVAHRYPTGQGAAGVARRFYASHNSVTLPVPPRGRFRLRFSQGRVSAWFNGVTIEDGYEVPEELRSLPDTLVGLGSHHDANLFTVRYFGVELRRLEAGAREASAAGPGTSPS